MMNPPDSASITESVLNSLDNLVDEYTRVIHEPNKVLEQTEVELRKAGGFIYSFEPVHILAKKSLVAIDGGRASQQLSGGDLIAAGATLADGVSSVGVYGLNPVVETHITIVPHTSDNETSYGARVMAALELRVLDKASTDHIIIDGAYLGNTSEVLFGLLNQKSGLLDLLMDFNKDDRLNSAMMKILQPAKDATDRIIAVPKSDSSYVQSKTVFGVDNVMASRVSDRKLASHILEPGEFMVPRPLESNPVLMKTLIQASKDLPAKSKSIVKGKLELMKELGGKWDTTYEDRLYTVYFKPSKWTKFDRALKVEFFYYASHGESVIDYARHIVQIINDDTVDNSIMEPYSQYVADRRAKEIGTGIDIAKQMLLNTVQSMEEANSIIRSYRT